MHVTIEDLCINKKEIHAHRYVQHNPKFHSYVINIWDSKSGEVDTKKCRKMVHPTARVSLLSHHFHDFCARAAKHASISHGFHPPRRSSRLSEDSKIRSNYYVWLNSRNPTETNNRETRVRRRLRNHILRREIPFKQCSGREVLHNNNYLRNHSRARGG